MQSSPSPFRCQLCVWASAWQLITLAKWIHQLPSHLIASVKPTSEIWLWAFCPMNFNGLLKSSWQSGKLFLEDWDGECAIKEEGIHRRVSITMAILAILRSKMQSWFISKPGKTVINYFYFSCYNHLTAISLCSTIHVLQRFSWLLAEIKGTGMCRIQYRWLCHTDCLCFQWLMNSPWTETYCILYCVIRCFCKSGFKNARMAFTWWNNGGSWESSHVLWLGIIYLYRLEGPCGHESK